MTMFTKQQIHEAFGNVKSGANFPQYLQDLKAITMDLEKKTDTRLQDFSSSFMRTVAITLLTMTLGH